MTLTKYSNPNDLGLVARRKLSMRLTSHENDTGLSSTAHGEGSSRSKVKLGCGADTAAYPPRVSDGRALQHRLSLPWALLGMSLLVRCFLPL